MEKLKLKSGHLALYLALLVVVVIVMILSRTYAYKNVKDESVPVVDTLKVAIQIAPLGVYADGDSLSGFYYDMIRQIAAKDNLQIQIDGFSQIATAIDGLKQGRYDVVVADIPVTSDLREDVLFTDPIYSDRQVLVQLKDSVTGQAPITNLMQLRGDTVRIAARSPYIGRICNLSRELGDTIYIVEDADYGPEQLMILTALGETRNVIAGEQLAKSIVEDYPQLDISLAVSFSQFQSWALAQGDTILLDSLNRCLSRFKNTPDFQRLLDKYFNGRPNVK